MTDLLPCPFCGGEAVRKHGFWIECDSCGAGVSAPKTDISARGVTARWNARHSLADAQGAVQPFDVMATIDPDYAASFEREKCQLCGSTNGHSLSCVKIQRDHIDADPVAWQWRRLSDGEWHSASKPEDPKVRAHLERNGYEFRALYVRPPAQTEGDTARVVTYTISIDSDGSVYNDTQTHGSTFAEVYRAFHAIRREVDRQIAERRNCPENPASHPSTQSSRQDG